MDVFFYEAFEEESIALKKAFQPHVSAGFSWKTIQETGDVKPPAQIISIRTQSQIPVEWATHLSGILSRSTGYDHIKSYLKNSKNSVPCGYLPLYCHRSVAEQAMLLWMALIRKLPQQTKNFTAFCRDGITGLECKTRTLLVVGVGNIGYEIVKIGLGLGMDVLGVDIVQKHKTVRYISIQEGLLLADVICCAMNLTSENIGYFNYSLLKKAKHGVIFVNIARGEISPSTDLLQLIKDGHLGGVALDVYDTEEELAVSLRHGKASQNRQVLAAKALLKYPNVILTPHNAFNTHEAVKRKTDQSVQQIVNFMEKGHFLWPVPD